MLFSIITPSYRQLNWLDLCAASIADQEVDVEHIVQDAGSPGAEEWIKSHPQVKVTVEADDGMYDAINRGLKKAQGDICAYLNCDEQYLPGTLRKVGDFFEQHPEVDVIFGDAVLVDAALCPLSYRRAVMPGRWHTLLRPLGVLTCSIFFRRKVVEDGVIFDPSWKIIGDKAWILELLDRGYLTALLPEPLALFAFTGANLSEHSALAAERQRWNQSYGVGIRLAKPIVLGSHFLKKWRQGAYQTRLLHSAWYTHNSVLTRRSFSRLTLGWKWPSV